MPLNSACVTHSISGVSFGVFEADEVRKLSVKQITKSVSLDRSMAPIEGGLYDPALGPIDDHTLCQTCGLYGEECPGHFGHIEFPVPLYNPLFFNEMMNLLRSMCLNCYKFRLKKKFIDEYSTILKCIDTGDIEMALSTFERLSFIEGVDKTKRRVVETNPIKLKEESLADALYCDGGTEIFDKKKLRKQKKDSLRLSITKNLMEFRNGIVQRMMKSFPHICQNCNAPKLAISKDGYAKIFVKRKNKTIMDKLWAANIRYRTPLLPPELVDADSSVIDSNDPTTIWTFHHNENSSNSERSDQRVLYPNEVKALLCKLWDQEKEIISFFYSTLFKDFSGHIKRRTNADIFFVQILPVMPSRFRPVNNFGTMTSENNFNRAIIQMLDCTKEFITTQSDPSQNSPSKSELWINLQNLYNDLIDNTRGVQAPFGVQKPPGIKQIIEKKEGLFRQNMMGKRVDFAARSVISPDPYIKTTEIGVPLFFAQNLNYPEPVTDHNIAQLRQLVENGPDNYPGANAIEDEFGNIISLRRISDEKRRSLAQILQKPEVSAMGSFGMKKVHRHLLNGDYLIVNRQPTLHKPSMMVHRAHVMSSENTIRMHYANCNSYNADFDGDEMNLHFLQNEMARAEAATIALNEQQYIVPKDGSPIRGLIQDHILSGVLITQRDTFLSKSQFQQLLYYSVWDISLKPIVFPPPTIIKPQPLWTGKQVISAVLDVLLHGLQKLNINAKCAVPGDMWGKDSEEGIMIIRDNNLLTGSFGKNQFGAKSHGMVHAVYELYSPALAAQLLTVLGRLLTHWLQMAGFTCGIDDALLQKNIEKKRWKLRSEVDSCGLFQAGLFLKELVPGDLEKDKPIPPSKTMNIMKKLQDVYSNEDEYLKWDKQMIGIASKYTSTIIDYCLSKGQIKRFPKNNLSLMTVSGAKGSRVNFSQISCLLGQQELEGRRVPLMSSHRSLPGFLPYDTSPRAGGYITDRFLTGVRPREYFFHCMAGREGLIDTAVKTSRSGYLQRCIIKNLETLIVQYDGTVRNSTDGSIVQFCYGEDGVDVVKSGYLEQFDFFSQNLPALLSELQFHKAYPYLNKFPSKERKRVFSSVEEYKEEKRQLKIKEDQIFSEHQLDKLSISINRIDPNSIPDPLMQKYPAANTLGAVSEKFDRKLHEFLSCPNRKVPKHFKKAMYLKFLRSLASPGEVVGVLAGQSIGEPSTQMTLNTFHLAGKGEVNVTLGIPRLKELIQTRGSIKTPTMTLFLRQGTTEVEAEAFAARLYRLTLKELIEEIEVKETLETNHNRAHVRHYDVYIKIDEKKLLEHQLRFKDFKSKVQAFIAILINYISKSWNMQSVFVGKLTQGNNIDLFGEFKTISDFNNNNNNNYHERDADEIKKKLQKGDDDDFMRLDEEDQEIQRQENIVEEDEYGNNAFNGNGDNDLIDDSSKELESEFENKNDNNVNEISNLNKSKIPGDSNDDETVEKKDALSSDKKARSLHESNLFGDYKVTRQHFEFTLHIPAFRPKILLVSIMEKLAESCIVREVPGIQMATVLKPDSQNSSFRIQTAGTNFDHIRMLWNIIDPDLTLTNHAQLFCQYYGIEAARETIRREISSVFKAYGIGVDNRHLTLVADYMTHTGTIQPMTRTGLQSSNSPFLKMSFESTINFLAKSCLRGDYENTISASSALVLGLVPKIGTNLFDILQNISIDQTK